MDFTEPTTFEAALKAVEAAGILPTSLSSRELRELLPAALRNHSIFSARVEQADILTTLKSAVEELAAGDVRGSSFTRAKATLLDAVRATGYSADPDEAGGLKDLTSDKRLSLMVETNVQRAQGFGNFVAGNDPVALEVNPGMELVRIGNPETPRNWEARWEAALAATIREGATSADSGRMVALKGHPVWQALGDGAGGYDDTLGNPYPPFAFASSMTTIPVEREDCEALGIIAPGETNPGEEVPGLNDSLQVEAGRFAPELARALAENPGLALRDGVLTAEGAEGRRG